MVTIPKEIMNKLAWREHQKVVVTEENGKITIEDWEA
ncbi:MAG: AbrB/MazE/SpoVT family DNA-binding domain-containing protein [Candidatus Saccharibacteria bacterium]|nr:AbrB/MazE/SpoVT family DNA-binding domain-containing protein [Candidatus Saccharibacteria bacterium]